MTDREKGAGGMRRRMVKGLGAVALGCGGVERHAAAQPEMPAAGAPTLPSAVAGVRIVDSAIARDATDLSRSSSPPHLFHHALRTYLFACLVGKASKLRFDEEILYLACVLHDLGLTERFAGDLPFELQGAEAARRFLQGRAYPAEGAEVVWDGIAMHASAIAQFKRPEIALVAEGAGADVLGPDFSQIAKADTEAIVRAFPRLGFKRAFVETCAGVIRRHPRAAGRSFMRDIGERFVPGFHPGNFCDRLDEAPYED